MPFIAKSAKTGDRIDITQYDGFKVRDELKAIRPVCQLCGEPLSIRSAHFRAKHIVSAHFYHKSVCETDYDVHPESAEHLYGKMWLKDYLLAMFSTHLVKVNDLRIEYEVPIPMTWRDKGRIADVLVTWPMGWREAHEIQLASITPQQLEQRTDDYERSGIDVYWWIGGAAKTNANIEFCIQRFGYCYSIDIQRSTHRV